MTAEERQKVKEARAAYAREWRKKNPGKNKEYGDRYWENRIKREMEEKQICREESNPSTVGR